MKTFAPGKIAGPFLWSLAKARVMEWERIAKSPRLVRDKQEEMLRAACRASGDSDFGRGHDLARVRSAADLRARVPLRTYDDYAP